MACVSAHRSHGGLLLPSAQPGTTGTATGPLRAHRAGNTDSRPRRGDTGHPDRAPTSHQSATDEPLRRPGLAACVAPRDARAASRQPAFGSRQCFLEGASLSLPAATRVLRLGNWFTAADPKRGAPALPPQKGATGRRALRVQRPRAVGGPDRSLRPGAPQQLSRGDGLTRVCYTAEYASEPLKACRHAARAHPGTGLSTPPGKRAPSGLGGCARRRASRCHAGDRTPPLCRGSTFNGRAPRAAPTERAAHAQPVHGARPPLADAGASHRSQSGPTNAPRRWQPAAARRAQRRPSLPQRGPLAPLASARRRQGTVRPPAYGWRGATLCGPRAVLLLLYRRYFLSPPAPSGASAPQAPPLACMRRERRDSITAPSERPGGKPRSGAGPPQVSFTP